MRRTDAGPGGEKWALLVGVDKCRDVGELTVCASDVLALKAMLVQIGYPSDHITVLVDDQSDFNIYTWPTLSNVERAVTRLAQVADSRDTILFFFSGHGVNDDGSNLLVPTDGDQKKGIALDWVCGQLASSRAAEKIVLLDACHSSASKGVSGIIPDLKAGADLSMLFSCEKDQVSWVDREGRHSVFTAAVLAGLGGQAADPDRRVTLQGLARYVQRSVKAWAYKYRKDQSPVFAPGTHGDTVLVELAGTGAGAAREPVQLAPRPEPVVSRTSWSEAWPVAGGAWTSPGTGMEFVWVEALGLWVGKYEVTNGEYRRKVPGFDSRAFGGYSLNEDRQPVVQVNFSDAKAYAEWLTARDFRSSERFRYRVISETEWQACAQCGDGREYPWGKAMPPRYGNYSDEGSAFSYRLSGYSDGAAVTAPVERSGGPNEWGLYGLGGNAWECCARDMYGRTFGAWRGASWRHSTPDDLSIASRYVFEGDARTCYGGFRLVVSP